MISQSSKALDQSSLPTSSSKARLSTPETMSPSAVHSIPNQVSNTSKPSTSAQTQSRKRSSPEADSEPNEEIAASTSTRLIYQKAELDTQGISNSGSNGLLSGKLSTRQAFQNSPSKAKVNDFLPVSKSKNNLSKFNSLTRDGEAKSVEVNEFGSIFDKKVDLVTDGSRRERSPSKETALKEKSNFTKESKGLAIASNDSLRKDSVTASKVPSTRDELVKVSKPTAVKKASTFMLKAKSQTRS